MGLRRAQIGVTLAILGVTLLALNVGQVLALTVNPSSPIAGQSFMITSSNSSSGDEITVRSGSGCINSASIVGGGFVGILGSLSLTLPAGQYSASGTTTPNGCVDFTVIPATTSTTSTTAIVPEYPYGLAILTLFMIFGYAVIKRKTRT